MIKARLYMKIYTTELVIDNTIEKTDLGKQTKDSALRLLHKWLMFFLLNPNQKFRECIPQSV